MRAVWILCALTALVLGETAHAARAARFEGTISAISTISVPPTVTLTDGEEDVTLNVTAFTRIRAGDGRGTIADLRVDALARATYDSRTLNALSIRLEQNADEAEARGVIVEADGSTGALSLDTDGDEVADLNLSVDAQTNIKVGSAVLAADQIDALLGLRAEVEYNSTTQVAYKVHAEGESTNAIGTVSAVGENSLTLDVNGSPLTLEVAAGADVRLLGQRVGLPAVQVGDTARVSYLEGEEVDLALRVIVLGVRPKHVNGTLTATGEGTLVVTTRTGEIELIVDGATDLRLNGRATTLDDLQAALDGDALVRVSAAYFERAAGNFATRIRVNARGRGGRGRR